MSFLNTLFKTIKTTADITSTSLDYISKGLEDVNKSINQEIQFQELVSDAKVAYNFIVESINTADELSDLDLKVSKYPSDLINEVRKLSSDSATKDFGLENQKKWLVMHRPTSSDSLLQAKADFLYQHYLVELEQLYARIRKKCAGSAEYERCLKKRLISMGCPYCFLTKLCPSAKFKYFSLPLQNGSKTSD